MDAPAFDPSKPFEAVSSSAPQFDPSKPFEPVNSNAALSDYIPAAIKDVPHEIYQAASDAGSTINSTLNPFSEGAKKSEAERLDKVAHESFLGGLADEVRDLGRPLGGLMAIPALASSPITGATRSLLGHPIAWAAGIPYPQAKEWVDTAMMGMAPGRGGLSSLHGPAPVVPPNPVGPFGVTLSKGQETGALPATRTEQAALRGQLGPSAEKVATDFIANQKSELANAKEGVARSLDPFGMNVADTPGDAGVLVSQGVQSAKGIHKAAVDRAYDEARALPGVVDANAFRGIGQRIKTDLSNGPEPVIIDDKTTPHAAKAIDDLDATIDKLKIQNKASPFPPVNTQNIVGVTLDGLDQARKRIATFRNDAFSSGNAADGRAAGAFMRAFDDQVDTAIRGGMFKGDPRAVQAWWDARAAHQAYRSTFSAGKNDPIGRVIEKITGKGNNPAAIPNDVADFLYGSSGTNPNSLNVGVANRVRSIVGDRSPEWSAVKQGLFSRLVEPSPGELDWGPQKISQRLNKFLNGDGRELAEAVLSPDERALMQRYADLQRKLIVPPTGANRSETSTFMAPMLRKISGVVGMLVGAALGHASGLPFGAAEAAGYGTSKLAGKASDVMNARRVAKMMPDVSAKIAQWQKTVNAANLSRSPLSQKAVAAATSNLIASFSRLGIDLLPSSVTAAPADNQQGTDQESVRH